MQNELYFWKGYNKLDTKLREIVERFIRARRKFDNKYKNGAVKRIEDSMYLAVNIDIFSRKIVAGLYLQGCKINWLRNASYNLVGKNILSRA